MLKKKKASLQYLHHVYHTSMMEVQKTCSYDENNHHYKRLRKSRNAIADRFSRLRKRVQTNRHKHDKRKASMQYLHALYNGLIMKTSYRDDREKYERYNVSISKLSERYHKLS